MPVHARRGEADFRRAVIVQPHGLDDRANVVAVRHRLREPFQNNHAHAVAENRALRPRVEGARVAVRRGNRALLKSAAALLRKRDRRAARERHVALVIEQALTREAHGYQRSGARGRDVDGRSGEVQFVGYARGEIVLLVAHHHHVRPHEFEQVAAVVEIAEVVGVEPHARENADRRATVTRRVARVFQRRPRGFEKDALLRVGDLGLARLHAEKCSVETVRVVHDAARADIGRIVFHRGHIHAGRREFLVGKCGNRLRARDEILPERRHVGCAGKSPGHTDDRDAFVVGRGHFFMDSRLRAKASRCCCARSRTCWSEGALSAGASRWRASALIVGN